MSAPSVATPIRLVVFDVDGTLTSSRHEVVDATRAAVDRIRAAGIRVVLATGRRYRDTLPVAERLAIDTPLVTASGALVKRPHDHVTLVRAVFAADVVAGVTERIIAAGHEPILYGDSFAAGYDFHCRRLPASAPGPEDPPATGVWEYLTRNAGLASVRHDLHVAPPADVFAGFAMGERDEMHALHDTLAAAYPGRLAMHVIRSPRYLLWMCEFAPAGVTKWWGVGQLATRWQVPPEAICAVGDDVNDLPMIRGAGLGIAMGNACDAVRAAADVVVGHHDASGIADVAELVLARVAQPAPLASADD